METYYVYDPVTFEYAGKVQCKNQPASSTTLAPVKVLNGQTYELIKPVFDEKTQNWQGTNADYDLQTSLGGLSKQVANLSESVNLIMDALTGTTKQEGQQNA